MSMFSREFWTQRGVIPRWQYLLVYLAIVAAGIAGFHETQVQSDKTERLSARTNAALCALRQDLKDRVHNSEEFLAQHPRGIPGIPAGTIRNSLEGQRRTINALAVLRC